MASIRPRSWTNPDGTTSRRWVLDYVDDKGKRHRRHFEKKGDANDERIRIEGAIADGLYVADRKGLTVKHACTTWLLSSKFLCVA